MKSPLSSILAALPLLASSHILRPRSQRRVCGNENFAIPDTLKTLHSRLSSSANIAAANFSATIPTYFHIVSSTANKDMVTDKMISDQLAVMNARYAGSGFSYNLVATDHTVNDQWASQQGDAAMQKALRKGTYGTLNIYFLTDLPTPLLGQCVFPVANPPAAALVKDGCEILATSMPGGTMAPYNLGLTVVHEVGHWLGLFHPFQGYSCTKDSDMVADTPFQSEATYNCPVLGSKDSCPDAPGVDGTSNYMDYADDACMDSFTPGQIARAGSIYTSFRAGK
ncbi:Extracellular metalloprotease [Venturia nashicola]|uniref:Extracellular metalloprotease n=1 Tax=Venturia nashicola TaxID=86259 RepID=A0A4Z1NZJ6_9PEZI|nr:Extracellular metalloprotease [Venturia nashicola]